MPVLPWPFPLNSNNYNFENIYVLFPIIDPKEFKKRNKDFIHGEEFFDYVFNKSLHLYKPNNRNLEQCIEDIKKETNKNTDFLNFIFTHGTFKNNIPSIEYQQFQIKDPGRKVLVQILETRFFSDISEEEKDRKIQEIYSSEDYKNYKKEGILRLISHLDLNRFLHLQETEQLFPSKIPF